MWLGVTGMAESSAEPGATSGSAVPDKAGEEECEISDVDEGEFIPVLGKNNGERNAKRLRVSSSDNDTSPVKQQLKFTIRSVVAGKNLAKVNPLKAAKEFHRICGTLRSMNRSGSSLVAVCHNTKQAQKLREITRFCDVEVTVTEGSPLNATRGVIKGVDLDITEPELLEELGDTVISVKRMKKRIDGKITSIGAVIIDFKCKKLPDSIYLGYEQKKVTEFRPPVQRCFNCQKYGHAAGRCYAKSRCPRCGENHKWEECKNKDSPKCANCGGDHSAAYLGCSQYKVAKDIQTIIHTEKLSYAEASKKYNSNIKKAVPNPKPEPQLVIPPAVGASAPAAQKPNPVTSQSQSQQPTAQHPQPQQPPKQQKQQQQQQQHQRQQQYSHEDNNMDTSTPTVQSKSVESQTVIQSADITPYLINEKILAFLAFIINNFTENQTKSSRIKLVVDAAKICCGVDIPITKVQNILQ